MPKTEVRSAQILNATVGRSDINTATPGEAIVAKIVAGTNITISNTGADSGTGDVTINATSGGSLPTAALGQVLISQGAGVQPIFSVDPKVTTISLGTNPATTGAIRLANGNSLYWRNAANTADISVLYMSGGNDIVFGSTAANSITIAGNPIIGTGTGLYLQAAGKGIAFDGGALYPASGDNLLDLGYSFLRWKDGYFAGRINADNTWAITGYYSGFVYAAHETLTASAPALRFIDTSQPANAKLFKIINYNQTLIFQAIDDAESTVQGQASIDRGGSITTPTVITTGSLALYGTSSAGVTEVRLIDNTAPANYRMARFMSYGQQAHMWVADDLGNPQGWIILDRNGHVFANGSFYELNRPAAQGVWIDVPYDPANFAAGGTTATWVVGPGSQIMFKYMLIGKTMFVAFLLLNTTITGGFAEMLITVPGGYVPRQTAGINEMSVGKVNGPYEEMMGMYVSAITNKISLQRQSPGIGWGTGNFTFLGELFFEVQ